MDRLFHAAVIAAMTISPVLAQTNSCGSDGCVPECGEAATPLPPWMGELCSRSAMTGDWGGTRSSLAESGITFQGNATQFFMNVANGGVQTGSRVGAHNDYIFNMDLGKLAGCEGASLKVRAEHHYGRDINQFAGSVLPATLATGLPVVNSDNVYLTNVLFTQFLSETCGVYFGKLDTLDGDRNAFAHGRGTTQFLNTSLVVNPALLRGVPYSTLGAGMLFILGPESIINIGVLNATDTTRTSGFDELFNDGAVVTAEGRFATQFLGKPGHQVLGGAWNSRDFTALEQDPRIIFPPAGIPIAQQAGTWGLYYNFDQYLVTDPCDATKGWGIFGRLGITDENPNPISYFASFGFGGNSPIDGHEADTWGLGWYKNYTSDELGPAVTAFLGADNGEGVECFYNIAVTPWCHVTADVQYISPAARNRADDAIVAGVRASIDL